MRAFVRRVVNAVTGKPESPDERRKEAAKQKSPPKSCDVCGQEGHQWTDCWTAIRTAADCEGTWRSGVDGGAPGDTQDAVRSFWRRVRGE